MENFENEFLGTPINLKDFGSGSFSDDEFDFLKKKPAPKPAEPPKVWEPPKPSEPPIPAAPPKIPEVSPLPAVAAAPAPVTAPVISEVSPPAPPPAVEAPAAVMVPVIPAVTPVSAPAAAAPEIQASPPAPVPVTANALPKKEIEPDFVQSVHEQQAGQIVKCQVVRVENTGVLVDFGYKMEGIIESANIQMKPGETLETLFKVGDQFEAVIISLEPKNGYIQLSKKAIDQEKIWAQITESLNHNKNLEARVTSVVKGGVVVDCLGLRGFIPGSHLVRAISRESGKIVGQILPVRAIEINRPQSKIIFSNRLAQNDGRSASQDKIFAELEAGQTRHGRVCGIKSFGAFVDLGGAEGLIHISEMSWDRVKNPADVLKTGDEIDVFVLGVDREKKKISLGLKQLQPDPWLKARDLYQVGELVKGKVARLVKFGAFVELEKGLEGLLHLTEMNDPAPLRPEESVKPGDEIILKILRIIPEEKKIGLSLKAARAETEKHINREAVSNEERKVTIGEIMKEKNQQIDTRPVEPPAAPSAPASPPSENPIAAPVVSEPTEINQQ